MKNTKDPADLSTLEAEIEQELLEKGLIQDGAWVCTGGFCGHHFLNEELQQLEIYQGDKLIEVLSCKDRTVRKYLCDQCRYWKGEIQRLIDKDD